MLDLDAILARSRAAKACADAATGTHWYAEENDRCWQLFSRQWFNGTEVHPLQLIKAPKKGTPYAEYWPEAGDAALIASAPEMARDYHADVEALVTRVRELEQDRAIDLALAARAVQCQAHHGDRRLIATLPEPPPGTMRVTASVPVTYDVTPGQMAAYLRKAGWQEDGAPYAAIGGLTQKWRKGDDQAFLSRENPQWELLLSRQSRMENRSTGEILREIAGMEEP